MANYTEHHHLHQWGPEDPFLRTDFNEDFARIDGALGRLAQVHADLNYHLYNLLLQNDYEGKYTGFKRAMLFDGFRDGSGIQSKSGFLRSGGRLVLGRTPAQTDIDLGRGGGGSTTSSTSTQLVTATGYGVIKSFLYYLYPLGSDHDLTVRWSLSVNDEVRESGASTPTWPSAAGDSRTIYCNGVDVVPGDRCRMSMEVTASGAQLYRDDRNNGLGGTFRIDGRTAASGVMTASPLALPAGQSARAWVRHRGGTVGLTLRSGGEDHPMAAGESRPAMELMGRNACTEQSFTLDRPVEAGDWQVVLTGALGDGEDEMAVYDYGVIVL